MVVPFVACAISPNGSVIADLSRCSKLGKLLDHLVGALLQKPRHVEAECLGGFQD
jgi:hypothetical protein